MNSTRALNRLTAPALAAALLLTVTSVLADPPGRVARLSYLGGDVSFAPAGENSWHAAHLNRPLVAGDRLWSGQGSRVELELGTARVRLDSGTSFEFLNLDDQLAQIQLTEGTVSLRVDHLYEGQVYEINTPTLAFVATQPGEYRLDIARGGDSTQVTVFDGYADVYGEGGRRVAVQAGSSHQFFDPALRDYRRLRMPRADQFDSWVFARNDRYLNSPTRQYVSTEMIGYADLDDHGSWRNVSDHGHVWFPRRVAAGWAPYRHGHWSWIDPWGWTWVDDAAWGFAPFHYGRWVYVSSGWGWVPGPRHVRPVYAPALVAFVGGSNWSLSVSTGGPPIGWFPLGPRDIYMPWYRVSRGYFGRVNVHNTVVINHVSVTNIYNDYYVQGRPVRRDYTFRNAVNAVTVVPRDSFVSSRGVAESMARLRPGQLDQGELLARAPAAPTRASLTASEARAAPPTRSLDRQVIARSTPAPAVAPFEARQSAIARNGGEPLARDQMQRLSAARGGEQSSRVRLIGSPDERGRAAGASAASERAGRGRVGDEPARASAADRADSPLERGSGRGSAAAADRIGNAERVPQGRQQASPADTESTTRGLPSARYVPRDGSDQRAGDSSDRTGRSAAPESSRQRPSSPSDERSVAPARAPDSGLPARGRSAPAVESRGLAPTQQRGAAPIRSASPVPRSAPREDTAPVQQQRNVAPARQVQPLSERVPARQAAPVRSAPDRQSAPLQSAPARQSAPVQSAPVRQAAPVRSAPARQSAPLQSAPARQSAPVQSAPVRQAAPVRSAPPQAPVPLEPARQTAPVRTDPARTDPDEREPETRGERAPRPARRDEGVPARESARGGRQP